MVKKGAMMVKRFSFVILIMLLSVIEYTFACPYSFINDSSSRLFLAETISHGHLIEPGQQTVLEAPMHPDHEKMHMDKDSANGEHEDDNGHEPFYVYIERKPGTFDAVYKIRERACGMGSIVKYSDLQGMATGEKDAGRFGVKILTAERAERKKSKLTPPNK